MKILIVDDDLLSREILNDILTPFGSCLLAKNGQEAVDCFTAAREQGAPFDVICLDFIMPVMDGVQARKHIRQIEQDAGTALQDAVKIIMISSMSDLELIMMGFDPVCDAYTLKPFDVDQLMGIFAGFGFQAAGR
ncbi:MAG: response regulator [Desulfuromonadales bacterium]